MATTGELRAIIEELHLVDAGDAASYLGEEATVAEESFELESSSEETELPIMHLATCDGAFCNCTSFS